MALEVPCFTLLMKSALAIVGITAALGATGLLAESVLSLSVLLPPSEQEDELTEKQAEESEGRLLSRGRKLTFAGKRSGEGYFSADGKKLIFQSERLTENPFYQIYVLDLETGDTNLASTGFGKTTCSWFHPRGNKALFASSHEDPQAKAKQKTELQFRESGKVRKYSWDYDEWYDIFEKDLKTGTLRNLTKALGYDAEGCYSPDGNLIVFASNRQAYEHELSEEEKKIFERDKSYFSEIFLMNADGSDLRRLTDAPGYDGGPFFNADGSRICWRRFSENGHQAEIYVMDVDGSRQSKLTNLRKMSWAPFFHPSGEYLIFSTNVHGFQNFELYLVDAKGRKEPVRVTFTNGFDGLPCFSPDGKSMAWTSNRGTAKQSQIHLARWNHEMALRLLAEAGNVSMPKKTQRTHQPSPNTKFSASIEAAAAQLEEELLDSGILESVLNLIGDIEEQDEEENSDDASENRMS